MVYGSVIRVTPSRNVHERLGIVMNVRVNEIIKMNPIIFQKYIAKQK